MPKQIRTVKGVVVTVDDDVFEDVNQYRWMTDAKGYTRRSVWNADKYKSDTVFLHRSIINAKKGELVDHINGDVCDNRKENLRIATRGQNRRNSKIPSTNTSGYKGVTHDKETGRWKSQVRYNKKPVNLGRFSNKHDAARMYNFWAKDIYGEFARLNIINETEAE